MNFKFFCLSFLLLLIFLSPSKIVALSHEWIAVPKSQYGEQLWDKNNIQKNEDGSIRVLANLFLTALMTSLKTFFIRWISIVRIKHSEMKL